MTDNDFLLHVLKDGEITNEMIEEDERLNRALPALIVSTTPEPPARSRVSDPDYPEILRRRIARRVVVDHNGCWIWQGVLNQKGYGQMGAWRNKGAYAHRVSYAVFHDETPIPDGWSMDHLCRNRACVNPSHLEPVPHGENVRRGNTGITWSSRTHCKNGHEFTPENTQMRSDGTGRQCKTCRREANARQRAADPEKYRLQARLYARAKRGRRGVSERWPGRKHPRSAE